MDVSRRDVLAGSVFAFGASALVLGSGAARADAGDEAAVIGRVDTLRKATQEADKAKLEQVTSAQLSYGHSGGRVETKEQFINGVMTQRVLLLHFSNLRGHAMNKRRLLSLYPLNLNEALTDLMKVAPRGRRKSQARSPRRPAGRRRSDARVSGARLPDGAVRDLRRAGSDRPQPLDRWHRGPPASRVRCGDV